MSFSIAPVPSYTFGSTVTVTYTFSELPSFGTFNSDDNTSVNLL
jgi:hypothetical protein